MPDHDPLKPFPGYAYSQAASDRADAIQAAARRAILETADGPLFDAEPAALAKTLARLAGKPDA